MFGYILIKEIEFFSIISILSLNFLYLAWHEIELFSRILFFIYKIAILL